MLRIVGFVIGYFIGCINFAYIIGRTKEKIDIREFGSGNSGTTNAIRVMGWRLGAATFVGDLLKSVAAYYLVYFFTGKNDLFALYAGAGAVIGHNWPLFLKFKGGKGIASSLGLIYAVDFRAGLIVNVVMAIIILLTKYVSLGSIVMAIMMPILFVVFKGWRLEFLIVGLGLMIIAIFRHRSNISRLSKGTENKVGGKK